MPHSLQGGIIDGGGAGNNASGTADDLLRHIEYSHCDVEAVCDNRDCHKGLEYPLEEDPGFKICQIVVVNNHLNQLVVGNKGENHACNRDDDGFGDILNHAENPRRKCRRGCTDLGCNISDPLIHRIKHPGQILHDSTDQHFFQPVSNLFEYAVHALPQA